MSSQGKRNDQLIRYKQAVWDFLIEHSDITNGGSLFIKFHASGRADFEKRIKARANGYHRDDPRLNVDTFGKDLERRITRKNFKEEKEAKRNKYILEREKRREALKKVKRANDIRRWKRKIKDIFMLRFLYGQKRSTKRE